MNDLLSPKEAARILGVSTQCLRIWEQHGKIKPIKTEGGHRRYVQQEVERLREKFSQRK